MSEERSLCNSAEDTVAMSVDEKIPCVFDRGGEWWCLECKKFVEAVSNNNGAPVCPDCTSALED
jgi:Zn finger protein HypA/HybF involved in hydrogenase expression